MAVEKIQYTDTLRQGADKINAAIDQSNEAIEKATTADANASQALATANNVQTQLNTIVIEGDSSVEAAQARVDAEGYVFTTLKDRLDTKEMLFSQGIEALQQDMGTIQVDVGNLKTNFDQHVIHPIYNIKGFGAVGDGVADDTAAIQAAINAVPAGGTVYIPSGTYVISSQITLKSGIQIFGAGKSNTKITLIQDVDGFQVFGTSENRLTDIYIGHFAMFSNTTGGNQRHIYLQEAENVTIEHLHLEGASNNAINVFASSHIRMNSVDITASGHFGILVYQSDNVSVTNCRIWDIEQDGASNLGLQFKSSQYCQAIGNRIENIAGYGIYLWTDGTEDCVGNIIIGNIIRNLLGTANTGEFARIGIYINESPRTIIEGNVVSNTASTGISIQASNGCRVSGNILEGTTGGGIGLVLNSSQNVIINNLIRDWDSNGIIVQSNLNYIAYNTITEGRLSASSLAAGIRLQNGASNNFILNNYCSNNQRRGIFEEATATPPNWNFFRDNICVNNATNNFAITGTNSLNVFNVTSLTSWPTFNL